MILRKGNLWEDDTADIILFTGNETLRADGGLVMGRGCAREALTRYPGSNLALGKLIADHYRKTDGLPYGVLWYQPLLEKYSDIILGVFQVKHHYRDDASLILIATSVDILCRLVEEVFVYPPMRVAMNFPGIQNGRLRRVDVLPLLLRLPDSVTVWEYADDTN